jgi:hypothetical protein
VKTLLRGLTVRATLGLGGLEEITYADLIDGTGKSKAGYHKISFKIAEGGILLMSVCR